MSVQGIAEKSKYRIAGRLIISIAIDNLLAKDAVYQAGAFHDYSGEIEKVLILYAAKIRFDEYYVEQFKNITPRNYFNLTEKMLQSNKLSPNELCVLSDILSAKTDFLFR